MWKVLLVIASFALGGALYLSYDNMGAVKQRQAELDGQRRTLEQRTASLAKANEEVAQLEQSIQGLKDEAETLETQKIALETKLLEDQAAQKAQEARLETAKTELANAKELIGDFIVVEAIQKEMLQIRTQIEESEIELSRLEGAVAAAQVERDRLVNVAAELAALRTDQEAGVIRGEFQSNIKRAFNQWGFVVVGGGYDQGVVNRAQLDVYRQGQPICRLLVTSVEPSETVADIVPGSLAPGQMVQVGDVVVKSVSVQTPAVVPAAGSGAIPAGGAAPAAPAAPFGAEGDMEPGMAAPDPFDGSMEPAPPAAPDPFGGSMEPAPDPFGGSMEPAPPAQPDPSGESGTMEPGAAPPDPFQ